MNTNTTTDLNELTALVVSLVAQEAQVRQASSIYEIERLMEIISEAVADKNAEASVAYLIATYCLKTYRNELDEQKQAEEARLANLREYWENKA